MIDSNIGLAGLAEGTSFLILLGIAMPLKHLADRPGAVAVVGWIHGVLWIVYLAALGAAWWRAGLGPRLTLGAFIASLLPFGPFVLDPHLRKREHVPVQRAAADI